MRETRPPISTEQAPRERCVCQPLSSQLWASADKGHAFVPVAPLLRQALQTVLADSLPHTATWSLLLLHITQFEYIAPPPGSPLRQRLRCHASATLLEQVIQNIRRALRMNDQLLVEAGGSGAALLLPEVDKEGIVAIAQRILQSLHLLQAETIVPPLRSETEIVLGLGAYSGPSDSCEALFEQASQVQECIIFRPAVLPLPVSGPERPGRREDSSGSIQAGDARVHEARARGIPFMQIPSRLPARLKQLIPYALALELRCAPVGRDHNRLTVAMANPTDARALTSLSQATGMNIFPVACEIVALETLLASGW